MVVCDVTKSDSIAEAYKKARLEFGGVDIVGTQCRLGHFQTLWKRDHSNGLGNSAECVGKRAV